MLALMTSSRPAILAAAFLAAALSAGCSAASAPEGAHSPAAAFTWKAAPLRGASAALLRSQAVGLAADDRSFVLAALGPPGPPIVPGSRIYGVPELFASSDKGAVWHPVTVPRLTALAEQPVAGYGGHLYLLGDASTSSGPALAIWTSPDGMHWSKPDLIPGPNSLRPSAFRGEVAGSGITASRRGAEVFLELGGSPPTPVEFWHASEGGRLSQTATEYLSYGGTQPVLSSDGSGYVFMANGGDSERAVSEAEVLTSPDGTTWTEETSAMPVNTANWGTNAGARNAGTLVVAGWTTSFADGISPIADMWTQTSQPDGTWTSTHDLDPGRLPQPGVGPPGTQQVNDVVPLGSGFLATGRGTSDAATPTPIYFAAVWYSADGRIWTKQPETTTGFEHASDMWGAAVHGRNIVLVGYGTSTSMEVGEMQVWHGALTTGT